MDFRALNAITDADPYLMPRVDELLESLGGAKVLSKMDEECAVSFSAADGRRPQRM